LPGAPPEKGVSIERLRQVPLSGAPATAIHRQRPVRAPKIPGSAHPWPRLERLELASDQLNGKRDFCKQQRHDSTQAPPVNGAARGHRRFIATGIAASTSTAAGATPTNLPAVAVEIGNPKQPATRAGPPSSRAGVRAGADQGPEKRAEHRRAAWASQKAAASKNRHGPARTPGWPGRWRPGADSIGILLVDPRNSEGRTAARHRSPSRASRTIVGRPWRRGQPEP